MVAVSPKRELAFLRDECLRQQEVISTLRAENARLAAENEALNALVETLEAELSAEKNLEKFTGGVVHGLLKALDDMGLEADYANRHDDTLETLILSVDRRHEKTDVARARLEEVRNANN